ncbi:hypothetical protein [Vibrio barjaei]|uniref:hypothetical protein n=1 Tax=Vibrio barjaei TaxID=1676683 RepID=UPI002283BC8E|nr:hypothetical protein [Vibrio barjaei]MCY9870510.1 hypothetical protein [Vibrio barjaei]
MGFVLPSSAFDQGVEAFKVSADAKNPYDSLDERCFEWQRGWCSAWSEFQSPVRCIGDQEKTESKIEPVDGESYRFNKDGYLCFGIFLNIGEDSGFYCNGERLAKYEEAENITRLVVDTGS